MSVHYRPYNSQKIAQHKAYIEMASQKQPKFYKIFVDDAPAVPKTDKPDEFDNYEEFLTPDSRSVTFVIYCSAHSNRNDKYHYSLTAKSDAEALEEGLAGIHEKSYNTEQLKALKEKRQQQLLESEEIKKLQQQLEDLNKSKDGLQSTIGEKDKELERLFKALEIAEANRNTIHGINISRALAEASEVFIRNNTSMLTKIPGLSGLAEIIDADTVQRYGSKPQEPQKDESIGEVSIKKKGQGNTEGGVTLSEQEKEFIRIFGHLQKHFTKEEIEQVLEILDILSLHKEKINILIDLLQDKKGK